MASGPLRSKSSDSIKFNNAAASVEETLHLVLYVLAGVHVLANHCVEDLELLYKTVVGIDGRTLFLYRVERLE